MHQDLLINIYKYVFVFCIFQTISQRYESNGQICRSGSFSTTSQSCLKHHVQPKSFDGARNHCRIDGGSLAKVSDKATNLLILGLLTRPKKIPLAWIGLKNDPANVTKWYWTKDDSLLQPPYDRTFEAEIIQTKTEKCGSYLNAGGYFSEYRTSNCSKALPFVCEMGAECPEDTHGRNCSQTCSVHCRKLENQTSCNKESGYCLYGCTDGYIGRSCTEETFLECPEDTYGRNCSQTCGVHCRKSENKTSCSGENGSCLDGCKVGYMGLSCRAECPDYLYGEDCLKFCSDNCAGEGTPCNHVNGFCTQGCLPGYTGGRCDAIKDEIILEREEGEMKSSSALLLSVFIALWFLCILLGATCIPKDQKQKKLPQRETDGLNTKIHSTPLDENLKSKSKVEVEKSHSEKLDREETAKQNKTLEYQKSQSFHQTLLEVFEINSTSSLK